MSVQPQHQNHTRALARRPADYRPNAAPAYYLGRPASLWVSVTSPRRRRRDTPTHLADASTGSQEQALFMPGGFVLKCSRGVPRRAPGGMPSPMPAYRAAVTRRSRTDIGRAGALIGGFGRRWARRSDRYATAMPDIRGSERRTIRRLGARYPPCSPSLTVIWRWR